MSVHAGSQGQCGCIFLIPFPRQTPHLETPLAPGHSHRWCLQRAIMSQGWGMDLSFPGLEFRGIGAEQGRAQLY